MGSRASERAISLTAAVLAEDPLILPPPAHGAVIPNEGSTLAGLLYWARYKSFWFGAISRIATFNGAIGFLLWAIDEGMAGDNPTLLQIRSNLPLTAFVAALIALAYAVGRLGLKLDPDEPLANAPALVIVVLVIVAVTSIAGPVFVAIGEACLLVLLLLVLRLRHWDVNAYLIIKGVLVASSIVLLGGIGTGIATGQLLETRLSLQSTDDLMRLFVLLLGLSLYFIEERRHWLSQPPTPVVIDRLQRACKQNDFAHIHRWLGEDLTFSQADQHLLAELILPRRLIVDGDVAGVPTPTGDFVLFRVKKGQVVEMRHYLSSAG
ncbi:MAG TPA: hypothetical protein VK009_22490 [Chloroflexota bacterium]|nr:hypothetical protein [Chloroflexota bacterium]